VQSVDEQPDGKTWTGQLRMKDGAFPDLPAWSRQFRAVVGEAFLIRGVEVAVDGVLVTDRDHLALRVPGLAVPLRLAPPRRTAQWDPGRKRERELTDRERAAYGRLVAHATSAPRPIVVRVDGFLIEADAGRPPTLSVLAFKSNAPRR
jgi:hypothetical protein